MSGLVLGLGVYSYSQLSVVDRGVDSVRPALNTDLDSLFSAGTQLLSGDVTESLSSVVDGLNIEQHVAVQNGSFIPVYLPSTRFIIFAGEEHGDVPERVQSNPSMWLAAHESRPISLRASIPIEEVPELAIDALINGGQLEFSIDARFKILGVGIHRRFVTNGSVTETVLERLRE